MLTSTSMSVGRTWLMKTRKKSCLELIDVVHDLNTFICCTLLSGRSASTFPMKPWCGSTRSLWSRDSVLLLSIQRGKYLVFALGWSSKSKQQKIHAIQSYIILETDNDELYQRLRHMVDGESSEDVQLDVLLFASVDECVSGKLENVQGDFLTGPPLTAKKKKS